MSEKKPVIEEVAPAADGGDLLAPGLIHEMRHPLMGIKAGLQLIGRELGPGLTASDTWSMVNTQLSRLEELFRSYHDFLAPERAQRCAFDVGPVVERAVELVRYRLRKLGPRFSLERAGAPLMAQGTVGSVLHAVVNLLVNALDALDEAPAGARLLVRALRVQDRIEVRVSDEGSGIPPELRARIFEPRFTTKGPAKGSGLGLAIARRMLEAGGGSVALVSEGDAGRTSWARTELCVSLPIAAGGDAQVPAPVAQLEAPHRYLELALTELREAAARPPRVLVVTDALASRATLAGLLRASGIFFEVAVRAEEAVGLLEPGRFNLALIDRDLPFGSGVELIRELRELDPGLEVVALVGRPVGLSELYRLGVVDHLERPFVDPELTQARLRQRVDRQALRARTLRLSQRLELARVSEPEGTRLPPAARPVGPARLVWVGEAASPIELPGVDCQHARTLSELRLLLEGQGVDLVAVEDGVGPLPELSICVRAYLGALGWVRMASSGRPASSTLRDLAAGALDVVSLDGPEGQAVHRLGAALALVRAHHHERDLIRLLANVDVDPGPTSLSLLPAEGSAPRVLVVEDDASAARLLGEALVAAGISVEAARGVAEATQLLAGQRFDAVIAARNQPGKGGFELAERARAALPDAAVVMVSAQLTRDSVNRAFDLGVDAFVAKPFEVDALVLQVQMLIERRRAQALARASTAPRPVGHVLVVGPDPSDRARLARLVGQTGHGIAPRPELGAGLRETPAPDGLIIDSRSLTPRARLELAAMRALLPHLKILVLTDGDGVGETVKALEVGAAARVVRPWTEESAARELKRAFG